MQASTDWSKTVRVEVRGDDVVGHAGNVIPRMLADNLGLTSGLSAALSRPEVLHDRGVVLPLFGHCLQGRGQRGLAEELAGTRETPLGGKRRSAFRCAAQGVCTHSEKSHKRDVDRHTELSQIQRR